MSIANWIALGSAVVAAIGVVVTVAVPRWQRRRHIEDQATAAIARETARRPVLTIGVARDNRSRIATACNVGEDRAYGVHFELGDDPNGSAARLLGGAAAVDLDPEDRTSIRFVVAGFLTGL